MENAQMSMQEIAGFLLSGNDVTEDVAETGSDTEIISVTEDAPEIPEKRKRGRPSKDGVAMTSAERSKRYRQKHRPVLQDRRVDLWVSTVERAEKLAAERGKTVAGVIHWALGLAGDEGTIQLFPRQHKLVKAAAGKAGEDMDIMVNSALGDIRDKRWDEMAEEWIRFRAEEAAKALSATVDTAA